MLNRRIPQVVPWLQEFSLEWKVTLASACLKPTYLPSTDIKSISTPALGASCRIRAGTKNSKKQILSDCSIGHGQNPVSSSPGWLEFMPDQESPRLYPGYRNSHAKENSAWRAHDWSRLIRYKEKRKEYPHSSCRIVPSRPGIKKSPAASLLQDLFKTATTYSPTCAVPSAWRSLTSLFGMGRGGTFVP